MAAALLERRSEGRILGRSAGSEPAASINTVVVEAMTEIGIDIATATPKRISNQDVGAADVVISMGCGDACPVYPGKRYLDWGVDDSASKDLPAVRRIRDEIDNRVQSLIAELAPLEAGVSTTPEV